MRKILVGIKRVVDHAVRIHVAADGSGVNLDGVKMSINPFDEIALEEGLRIRERSEADEVIVASIGSSDCHQQLRTALALGADRAVHIDLPDPEPLNVARALLWLVRREDPLLVLLGKQSIDGDNAQTGPMLAGLWGRPQACNASQIIISGDSATVSREVDAGIETLEIDLPGVVSADLRLNSPRFVRLPEMIKARRKPIETVSSAALEIDATPQFRLIRTSPAPQRSPGERVSNTAELYAKLCERGLL
ncbi:MAG TPA: electron transfer flavoprotein subunit beta/FixA family protein [Gammaproteobacteria bacterium]|nr:electron transfer flavoprotein subunit beta/FixA family protein [Gammaproteobacteria bacterium]